MRTEVNTNSRGYEIDFRDVLARLLDKWYVILIFLLIGAAIGGLLGWRHNQSQQSRMVTQQDVEEARSALSDEDADHVENLYRQYASANEYRNALEKYLSGSMYDMDEFASSIILNSVYYVDSSEIDGAEKVIRLLALDLEDCEKIAKILGLDSDSLDSDSLDDVYRRVNVSGISDLYDRLDVKTLSDEKQSLVRVTDQSNHPDEHLLQVWVIADNREQADQIMAIVEDSFDRSLKELKTIDKGVELTCLGQKYSSDVYAFFQERETELAGDLYDASYQITRMKKEFIDELDSSQKHLFDTLKAADSDHVIKASPVSLKRNAVLGAIIGLIVGIVLVILQYLFDGKLKNTRELAERYGVEVSFVFYQKMKHFRLFGGLIRRLTGADLSDEAIQQKMAASDIAIKLEKSGIGSVCIVCDDVTEREQALARKLAEDLAQKDRKFEVSLCNPLKDEQQLETFSQADAAILVTQLKKTRSVTVRKWVNLCERYQLPMEGVVALEEC